MDWKEQVQEATRPWVDLQKRMMSEWSAAAKRLGAQPQLAEGDWAKQWQRATTEGMEQWLGKADGVQGEVTRRLLDGGNAYRRFFELFTEAMTSAAPKMANAGDWAASFRNYLEGLQQKMSAQPQAWMKPESAAALCEDAKELWQLYLGEVRAMSEPWTQSLDSASGHMGEAMAGDHRAMIRMFNLFTDTFESTIGKFVGAPAIGYSREYQEKLMKAFDTWVEMKKAEAVFNTEMVNIGFRALQSLAEELKRKAERQETIESPRELFDLWVNTAERCYFDATRTEAFAKIQASLVNSAMHYRVHEKTLMEVYQKAFHLPTRREVDDGYRHMHDLRKQVKQLKRGLATTQESLGAQGEAVAQEVAKQVEAAGKLQAGERAALEKQLDRRVATSERQLERKVTSLEKKLAKLTDELKALKQPATRRTARKSPKAASKPTTTGTQEE